MGDAKTGRETLPGIVITSSLTTLSYLMLCLSRLSANLTRSQYDNNRACQTLSVQFSALTLHDGWLWCILVRVKE